MDFNGRRAQILGGREYMRLGAVSLGRGCTLRFVLGVPVTEWRDSEKA
jgi:hypothetical protein